MSTNQWKLIKFITCAIAIFGLGWLFSIKEWGLHHAGFFAFYVGVLVLFLRSVFKDDTRAEGMSDKDIHRVVELVMYFVRTRRNASSIPNAEIFHYVKSRLKE